MLENIREVSLVEALNGNLILFDILQQGVQNLIKELSLIHI